MSFELHEEKRSIPRGKYSYELHGLADYCFLEGFEEKTLDNKLEYFSDRLLFRIDLLARCFVTSVKITLPENQPNALQLLNQLTIERSLNHEEFEIIFEPCPEEVSQAKEESITRPAARNSKGGKLIYIRRAADSLRFRLPDIPEDELSTTSMGQISLGITVSGFKRGHIPVSPKKRIALLNLPSRSSVNLNSIIDEAEKDALVGTSFLGSGKFYTAAEILGRSAEQFLKLSNSSACNHIQEIDCIKWGTQLNILSAYSYFQHHSNESNDCLGNAERQALFRLIQVSSPHEKYAPSLQKSYSSSTSSFASISGHSSELFPASRYVDIRTELMGILENIMKILTKFISDERAPTVVRMACCEMIEIIIKKLGIAIIPHIGNILNSILRTYSSCKELSLQEQAATATLHYDSLEDCLEKLVDMCCQLLPHTEHAIVFHLYSKTLEPLFFKAFKEKDYLINQDEDFVHDDIKTISATQLLRVILLSLKILGSDAQVPTRFVTRVLNIIQLKNYKERTSQTLRRIALHTWDMITACLMRSTYYTSPAEFDELFNEFKMFIPKCFATTERVKFQYKKINAERFNNENIIIFKENELAPAHISDHIRNILEKRKIKTEIIDFHTLQRIINTIKHICLSMKERGFESNSVHCSSLLALQSMIGEFISDISISTLVDVSHHAAVDSGNGNFPNNSPFEFGSIQNQLRVVEKSLEILFDCYWSCLNLFPTEKILSESARTPVRTVLGWCTYLMKSTAPPTGMITLMCVLIKGLSNKVNKSMFGPSKDDSDLSRVTFVSIYRAHLTWIPRTVHKEPFELIDILNGLVSPDLLGSDLLKIIQGMIDQAEDLDDHTENLYNYMSNIVASKSPGDIEAVSKDIEEVNHSNHRRSILKDLCAKTLSNYRHSFYLHVVLSSFLDLFESINSITDHNVSASFKAEQLDAFIGHASFTVQCLSVSVSFRHHRGYIGSILSTLYNTCLLMQYHLDSRVRLAGFKVFSSALDVLFLAKQSPSIGLSSHEPTISPESNNVSVLESSQRSTSHESLSQAMEQIDFQLAPEPSLIDSSSTYNQISEDEEIAESNPDANENDANTKILLGNEKDVEAKMNNILSEGGSWTFKIAEQSLEDRQCQSEVWDCISEFISSSMINCTYIDVSLHKSYLQYLQHLILNAFCGRSSGTSFLSMSQIDSLWNVVSKLISSPSTSWRTLKSLAMWLLCSIINLALFSMGKKFGKGEKEEKQQKIGRLSDFIKLKAFSFIEKLFKSQTRENRLWGLNLVEVYFHSRELNKSKLQDLPILSDKLITYVKQLCNDWDDRTRTRINVITSAFTAEISKAAPGWSFQPQFMVNVARPIQVKQSFDLWFPKTPDKFSDNEILLFQLNAELLSRTPISSGEEEKLFSGDREDDEEIFEDGINEDVRSVDEIPGSGNAEGDLMTSIEANSEEIIVSYYCSDSPAELNTDGSNSKEVIDEPLKDEETNVESFQNDGSENKYENILQGDRENLATGKEKEEKKNSLDIENNANVVATASGELQVENINSISGPSVHHSEDETGNINSSSQNMSNYEEEQKNKISSDPNSVERLNPDLDESEMLGQRSKEGYNNRSHENESFQIEGDVPKLERHRPISIKDLDEKGVRSLRLLSTTWYAKAMVNANNRRESVRISQHGTSRPKKANSIAKRFMEGFLRREEEGNNADSRNIGSKDETIPENDKTDSRITAGSSGFQGRRNALTSSTLSSDKTYLGQNDGGCEIGDFSSRTQPSFDSRLAKKRSRLPRGRAFVLRQNQSQGAEEMQNIGCENNKSDQFVFQKSNSPSKRSSSVKSYQNSPSHENDVRNRSISYYNKIGNMRKDKEKIDDDDSDDEEDDDGEIETIA